LRPSVDGVKQFLVEVFVPRSKADALAAAEQRAREAARRLSENAAEIRYVRATYVPEDETCFHVFDAPSAGAVAEASRLAGLGEGRIVEVTTTEKGERK
jgi:uncharacterized protein DUF4242